MVSLKEVCWFSFCILFFAGSEALPSSKEAETKAENGLRVVCYYGSWAAYRLGNGNFQIEDVDASLCTHFIYSFAGLDPSTFEIISLDSNLDKPDNGGKNAFGRAVHLRSSHPGMKVLLAIGGWNEGSYKYSVMAGDPNKRAVFIDSVVQILQKFGFDGLDIDWEYPGSRGGAVVDYVNLITLLKELREEFDKHDWLLSIATGMGKSTLDAGYDMSRIGHLVDFVNLMTYDFRSSWDGKTGHHTQMFARPVDQGLYAFFNLNSSVHLWLDAGAPPSKLNLGIAFYGKTYEVSYGNGPLDSPSVGPGVQGEFTHQPGFIGYNELCYKLVNEVWRVETDDFVRAPWAYKDNQWVAYDNVNSVVEKSNWAKNLGLGGGMVWSIETDDFKGECGDGKFPLLQAMNTVWRDGTTLSPPNTKTTTTKKTGPTEENTENPLYDGCNSSGTQYLAQDHEDCSGYYQCAPNYNGGSWIRQSCPHGLFFNEDIQACDYTPSSGCLVLS